MELPIFNCVIDENLKDKTGIFAMSFVKCPAVDVDFVKLSEQMKLPVHLHRDKHKQILTGAVLKPEQLIYRKDSKGNSFYIRFSADEIEKITHKMLQNGIAIHNTTHQHQIPLSNNYLVECWLIEDSDNDKANALGFKDLPKGTLMVSYKITDSDYWNKEVLTGNVKGFSLEGLFYHVSLSDNKELLNKSPKNKDMNKDVIKLLNLADDASDDVLLSAVKKIVEENNAYKEAEEIRLKAEKEANEKDAKNLLEAAFKDGRLNDDEEHTVRALWKNLFKNNHTQAKTMLAALPKPQTARQYLDTSGNADEEKRVKLSKMTFDELDASGDLEFLKANMPEVYELKFEQKFGKKPEK
jgi:hypothetical protein